MQIQTNYSTNYKQNKNFGAVPRQDLMKGSKYCFNTLTRNPLLHGAKIVIDDVESLANGVLRVDYEILSTHKKEVFYIGPQAKGLKVLDAIKQ